VFFEGRIETTFATNFDYFYFLVVSTLEPVASAGVRRRRLSSALGVSKPTA
jgi:hypothetical protein